MTTTVVVIYLVVSLGRILGRLPFLQLDRTSALSPPPGADTVRFPARRRR